MSMFLQICFVGVGYYVVWLLLWEGYQCFYKIEIVVVISDVIWQCFFDVDELMNVVFVWFDECVVGLVYWIYYCFCWIVGDYCYLQDLFVVEGLCGEGIGCWLIEYVYVEVGVVGCLWVYWLIYESNSDVMKLYECIVDKFGFFQYCRIF